LKLYQAISVIGDREKSKINKVKENNLKKKQILVNKRLEANKQPKFIG
jgi:hypothetical protein